MEGKERNRVMKIKERGNRGSPPPKKNRRNS
jgi:hypothetical protein